MGQSNRADLNSFYEQYMARLKEKAVQAVNVAIKNTWQEFFISVEHNIREIFNDVVSAFYDDYASPDYTRSRSLYDLLVTEIGERGDYLKIWFDPTRMTTFRSGYDGEDGLYDQVFRRGWHGGSDRISSDKIAKYGAHPKPGTPYWRTPVPFYTHWGKPAKISKISPLDDMRRRVAEYEKYAMQSEFLRIWNKHKNNIQIDI